MKRFIVSALAVVITACASSSPAPVHHPPAAAIVALANPEPQPVPQPTVVDHKNWSWTLPAGWNVDKDTDDNFTAHSQQVFGRGPITLAMTRLLDVGQQQQFITMASLMVTETIPPAAGKPINVIRHVISWRGLQTAVTTVITDKDVGVGSVAFVQPSTHMGYVIICVADRRVSTSGRACADLTNMFTLK